MITTVIVDDELWVCQLIKRIVNWEELNFSIVGEAYDGNEALELIKTKKPELVITDIRMPGIDGITLIKNVKELGLETGFIIISGYSDFEYAKGALKYGALGYLLKPIDRKELTDLLMSVRTEMFKNREKVVEEKLVKGKLARSLNQLQKQFFTNFLLSDSTDAEKIDIEMLNREYESKFRQGCFQTVIYKIDYKSIGKVDEASEKEALDDIQEAVLSEIEPYCFDVVTVRLKNQLVCILNYQSGKENTIQNSIRATFEKVRAGSHLMRDFDLTVGIGSHEADFCLLPFSYKWANNSIKARVSLGVNKILDISKHTFSTVELKELFPIDKEMKLSHLLEMSDNNASLEIIGEILGVFKEKADINPCLIFDVSLEIAEVFFKVMRRLDIGIEKEYISKSKVYSDIGECKSIAYILDYFKKLLDGARSFYNNLKQNQNRKAIEMVKAYICDHYKEEVNLNDAASLVFLNPKYLGELFKKETGINFSDYVINYRLDVAKELLKDVKYRTNEVAEMVGYKDAKHFSKLFKKIVGVNPAEYKKMFA